MDDTAIIVGGLALFGTVITALCGVLVAKVSSNHKDTKSAVELARPTGNGFAASVITALADLKNVTDNLSSRVTSMENNNVSMVNTMTLLSNQVGQVVGRVDRMDGNSSVDQSPTR